MAKFVDEGIKVEAEYAHNRDGCVALPAMNALAVSSHKDRYPSKIFR